MCYLFQILVYTFLDVNAPCDKMWKTCPFELVDTGEYLFGKGVARGKGPLVCWLSVIYIYQLQNKELPVNIKFIVESMHEQNHAGLEKFLHGKRNKFLADIDYIILNETEWLGTRMPCLSYGTVGKSFFIFFLSIYFLTIFYIKFYIKL